MRKGFFASVAALAAGAGVALGQGPPNAPPGRAPPGYRRGPAPACPPPGAYGAAPMSGPAGVMGGVGPRHRPAANRRASGRGPATERPGARTE